eukprot:GFUD01020212.1.p1 GENE.GFUD01020212.1~~GFUD01020212.1.p1  ORF type:complete len:727 (+),score=163.86 GFUD01020212.1:69-2249(+)
MSSPLPDSATSTLACLLCGVAQLYPGQRYQDHLVHEHGVIFGADFIIQASLHKQSQLKLPHVGHSKPSRNSVVDRSCQVLCSRCTDTNSDTTAIKQELDMDKYSSTPLSTYNIGCPMVDCWQCPLCPMVYKRRYHFDHHLTRNHQLQPEEVSNTWRVSLTEEEFSEKTHQAKLKREPAHEESGSGLDTSGCKSDKKWGSGAFSTRFSCSFCGDQFKRDSNLLVHLKLVHKDEPQELFIQSLDKVSQYKLDGCVYQCKLCGNKFSISTSFMRHVRDVHSLTLKDYHQTHGSAEIVSGIFSCKLCNKNIKHTRNIVTAHMKMVHQISWQEYQNRINQSSQNDNEDGNSEEAIQPLVFFECALCSAKVKLKRQHLDKAHHMDEDAYEALIEKGQDAVAGAVTCKICKRLCMNLFRHLKLAHKMMSLEEYELVPQFEQEETFSIEDPTSLKCYFKCKEVFMKEVDLMVHLDLKHSEEELEEFTKARKAAMDEAAFKQSSMSIWCEICDSFLSGRSSFWGHITRKHQMSLKEYEEEFGNVSADSEPFQCMLCSKILKHERGSITTHLRSIHGITWAQYLTMACEEKSGTVRNPPTIAKMVQCKLCNANVKHLKGHLKNTHCMTVKDYDTIENVNVIKQLKNDSTAGSSKSSSSKPIPVHPDVRNKSLKSCNKCQLNFPTRKQFLEHCQVVHGMKFKLKSGESLPPPPMNKTSIFQPPDSKRSKLKNDDNNI